MKNLTTLALILFSLVSIAQDTTEVNLYPQFLKAKEIVVIDEDTTVYTDSIYLAGYMIVPNRLTMFFYIVSEDKTDVTKIRNINLKTNVSVNLNDILYTETVAYWISNIHKYTEKNAKKILKKVGKKVFRKYSKNH